MRRQVHSSPSRRIVRKASAITALAALAGFAAAGPASAGTTGTGTTNAVLSAGSLAVTNVASATNISGTVAASITGTLPAVTLQDTTGSGVGWNATVGISDLTFTGTWAAVGSATALTTNTSGAYSDTVDGVTYTVTTGTITAGAGTFSYTSTDSNDASGSGTAVASTANAVGTKGLTINLGTQALSNGSQYRIHVGTQAAGVASLHTAGGSVTTTTGNSAPTLTNDTTTVTGGGVSSSSYGSAVKFVTAAIGNGMGTYVATPGVNVATDSTSWAGTYTAGLQYTIVTGP